VDSRKLAQDKDSGFLRRLDSGFRIAKLLKVGFLDYMGANGEFSIRLLRVNRAEIVSRLLHGEMQLFRFFEEFKMLFMSII
jgi:hypothetical protein